MHACVHLFRIDFLLHFSTAYIHTDNVSDREKERWRIEILQSQLQYYSILKLKIIINGFEKEEKYRQKFVKLNLNAITAAAAAAVSNIIENARNRCCKNALCQNVRMWVRAWAWAIMSESALPPILFAYTIHITLFWWSQKIFFFVTMP